MQKQQYEKIKRMRINAANGTATFAERNILKIIDKKTGSVAKHKKPVFIPTRITKRFGS